MNWLMPGEVTARLERLPPPAARIFALSCAEVLFEVYRYCCEQIELPKFDLVRHLLDAAWIEIEPERSFRDIEQFASQAPGDESPWNPLNPLAENASVAIYYALKCCRSNLARDAEYASLNVQEAVDHIAQRLCGEADNEDAGFEKTILMYPAVQRELNRQEESLALLENGSENALDLIRNKATADSLNIVKELKACGLLDFRRG